MTRLHATARGLACSCIRCTEILTRVIVVETASVTAAVIIIRFDRWPAGETGMALEMPRDNIESTEEIRGNESRDARRDGISNIPFTTRWEANYSVICVETRE